jgi:hypothetical protein
VGNSPTNSVDPSGEFATLITGAGGAAVGALIGGGLTWIAGGDANAIRNNAIKGAIQGGVTGLTLGVGGAGIDGIWWGNIDRMVAALPCESGFS